MKPTCRRFQPFKEAGLIKTMGLAMMEWFLPQDSRRIPTGKSEQQKQHSTCLHPSVSWRGVQLKGDRPICRAISPRALRRGWHEWLLIKEGTRKPGQLPSRMFGRELQSPGTIKKHSSRPSSAPKLVAEARASLPHRAMSRVGQRDSEGPENVTAICRAIILSALHHAKP